MTRIVHITEPPLWERSLVDGADTCSTRDAAFGDVGFIHCSFRHQVEAVANAIVSDWTGPPLVLEVSPEGGRLEAAADPGRSAVTSPT